jgi:kynurenine formamidase
MRLVDLTLPVPVSVKGTPTARLEEVPIGHASSRYTGMIYHFQHNSMVGTYIDFPGHIKETDDGVDAASYPLDRLVRIPAFVIHLDREGGSGGVSASELATACPPDARGGALILNALGSRRFDEIEFRSVWIEKDAVQWIIGTGAHLLISDIYESPPLHGVFFDLFTSGVSTVCCPINLHLVNRPRATITVLTPRFPAVTQIPCRVVAEVED